MIEYVDANIEVQSPMDVQLAIVAVVIPLATVWKPWGLSPDLVISYSLGEHDALHIYGVLSASDTYNFIRNRAKPLKLKCKSRTHGRFAVFVSLDVLRMSWAPGTASHAKLPATMRRIWIRCAQELSISMLLKVIYKAGVRTKPLGIPFGFRSERIELILFLKIHY